MKSETAGSGKMAMGKKIRARKEQQAEDTISLWDSLWRSANSPLSLASVSFFMLAVCIGMGQALYESKKAIHALGEQLHTVKVDLYRAETRLHRFTELEPRTGNFRFIDDQHEAKISSQARIRDAGSTAADTEESDMKAWEAYLDTTTPSEPKARQPQWGAGNPAGSGEQSDVPASASSTDDGEDISDIDCNNPADVILSRSEVWGTRPDGTTFPRLSDQAYKQGLAALRECGYLYLEDLIAKDKVQRLYQAFTRFRNTTEATHFRFRDPKLPGVADEEHMLPFRQPFNSSGIHTDVRIRKLLEGFLEDSVKLERMTVRGSSTKRDQPWHQAWDYLFHPSERLPPYSVTVSLPLQDVPTKLGSTQVCPGKKRRYYEEPRCDDAVDAATQQGTVLIMDSKLLRRNPRVGVPAQQMDQPVLEMTFSKLWFMQLEAYIQRPVSFVQTIHQRRYWEQWVWQWQPDANKH